MAGLSERDQAVIECPIEGKSIASLSRPHGFKASTLIYHKRRLAKSIVGFMGDDILAMVRRQPGWKDSLDATREKLAVRYERSH